MIDDHLHGHFAAPNAGGTPGRVCGGSESPVTPGPVLFQGWGNAMPRRGGRAGLRIKPDDSESNRLVELDRLHSRITDGLCPPRGVCSDLKLVLFLSPGANPDGELLVLTADAAVETE